MVVGIGLIARRACHSRRPESSTARPLAAGSTFTVQVADGVQTAQKSLTITINGALTITTVSLPNGVRAPVFANVDRDGRNRDEHMDSGIGLIPGGLVTLGGRSHRAGRPRQQDQRLPCRWPMAFRRRRNP